jgi:hypothetical protein
MTATATTGPMTTTARPYRAGLVAAATAATSTAYLAASAAGVDFLLTDSQSPEGHHLVLPEIAGFTLVFAGLGWGTLAILEKVTRHAKAVWLALATAVLLLSFVPIALETATAGTKTLLVLIHIAVFAVVAPMARGRR